MQRIRGKVSHFSAKYIVVSGQTEYVRVAGNRQCGVRCRGRDHDHLRIVVDLRRGYRHARIPVPDYCEHTVVYEFLRNSHSGLRIGLIVHGNQFKLERLAIQRHTLCIEIIDSESRAALVVFAARRLRTRQWTCDTNLHYRVGMNRRGCQRNAQACHKHLHCRNTHDHAPVIR
jgi:hypothetical protein